MGKDKRAYIHICLLIVGVISIMLLAHMAILSGSNIKKANEYADVTIKHIQERVADQRENEEKVLDLIKRDYMSSADTVAFIIENMPQIGNKAGELQKIAEKALADEINILDAQGVILYSSREANKGFDFRKEAPGYLDSILAAKSGSEFESITKNTPSGIEMAYATSWSSDGETLIQIGINRTRYDSTLDAVGIAQLIRGFVLSEGTRVYVASAGSYFIVGSSQGDLIGQRISETGAPVSSVAKYNTYFFSAVVAGEQSYCAAAENEDYYILVAQEKMVVNGGVLDSTGIMFIYLMLAGLCIAILLRRMTKKLLAEEERANRDKMTGFLNRRAYETQMASYESIPTNPGFTFAAFDLNGLKKTNDSKGHDAGDELIRGGAECIMQAFGQYGKLYRTGGDEFVAILDIDPETLEDRKKHFEKLIKDWSGLKVLKLAISAGYVTREEFPDKTVREMEKMADERMYRAKDQFYLETGQDRRRPR